MKVQPFFKSTSVGQALVEAEVNILRLSQLVSNLPGKQHILELLVELENVCQFQQNIEKPLTIDYAVFKCLSKNSNIHDFIREQFFHPAVFLRLPKVPGTHHVSITVFLNYMCKCISQQGLYCSLARFSVGHPGSEFITSLDALEDWLYTMSARLVQVQKMSEQFLPLWVFTAAHTVAFFHGKQFTNRVLTQEKTSTVSLRINIGDFVRSGTMKQLLDMRNTLMEDAESNLFARIRAVRYYDSFTVFDTLRFDDSDTLISPTEACCIFAGGYMNPVFVNRLVGIYVGGPPIDYRRFLTFAIAWENRRTPSGIRYFWPILDVNRRGFIEMEDMYALVDGMVSILQSLPSSCGPQGSSARSILLAEISDILRSNDRIDGQPPAQFTLARALESPAAFGTIIGLIANTQAFVEYECREDTAHKQFISKQMREAKLNRENGLSRSSELIKLQKVIDDTWFEAAPGKAPAFASFVEFLDHHEQVYGGQAMEPWLTQYYQWEAQEADNCQFMMDSQLGTSVDSSDFLVSADENLRSRE